MESPGPSSVSDFCLFLGVEMSVEVDWVGDFWLPDLLGPDVSRLELLLLEPWWVSIRMVYESSN